MLVDMESAPSILYVAVEEVVDSVLRFENAMYEVNGVVYASGDQNSPNGHHFSCTFIADGKAWYYDGATNNGEPVDIGNSRDAESYAARTGTVQESCTAEAGRT